MKTLIFYGEKYSILPKSMDLWFTMGKNYDSSKNYGTLLYHLFFFEQLRKNMALYQNLWYMYYTENTRPQILVYKIMLENPCTEMNKWFSFGITYVLTIITFSIIQLLNTCSYLWKLKTKIYFNKSLQISLIITKWWF